MAKGRADQVQAVKGNRQRVICQLSDIENITFLHQRMIRFTDSDDLLFLIGVDGQGGIAGEAGTYEADLRYVVEDIGNRKITGNFVKIKIDLRVCRPEIIEEMVQKIGGVSRRD